MKFAIDASIAEEEVIEDIYKRNIGGAVTKRSLSKTLRSDIIVEEIDLRDREEAFRRKIWW